MAITTGRTVDELKVILNGTISQYNNLSDTDKKGTVFFDRNNKAVYVEGILASSNVKDITYEGTLLTITFINGSSIPIEMSVSDALTTLKNELENWSNARFVRFDTTLTGEAALTDAQKQNARTNIGAVKAEAGKGLSTEDFTTALKQKLDGLSNYDDTELESAITTLTNRFNTLLGSENGDIDEVINTFNEIVAFLNNIKETDTLEGVLQGISEQFDGLDKRVKGLENETKVKSINSLSGNVTIKGETQNVDDEGYRRVTPITFETSEQNIVAKTDAESIAILAVKQLMTNALFKLENISISENVTETDYNLILTVDNTPKVWKFKEQ